jgi:PKD repeat protein
VELALVLPILLLILLVAIDFGRVYLGWVNLQQMSRVAANFAAEHASAFGVAPDPVVVARYRALVENDARQINCVPQSPIPDPIIAGGTALGDHVQVEITCEFSVITPIISQILDGTILVTASTVFPIKEGAVAVVPGGGGPIVPPPVAKFVGSPRSGWGPLAVTFTDQSTGGPTSWVWDFETSGTGTGSATPGSSLSAGPHQVTYSCTGATGDTCTFGVSLAVANSGGSDIRSLDDYITVIVPPATGPIADFTGSPRMGTEPLAVDFDFVDVRAGTVTYTAWEWDFTNDGVFDATGRTASHTYASAGAYAVRLRVTDDAGATNELTKVGYIVVNRRICTVPDFAGVRTSAAQSRWANAGFTTTVAFLPGGNNYRIRSQSLLGGTIDPQPDGCASPITVGP